MMKKTIILALSALACIPNLQAQSMPICGSDAHEQRAEAFIDLMVTGRITRQQKVNLWRSLLKLKINIAKHHLLEALFGKKKDSERKFEQILDDFFGCTGSLAWIKRILTQEGLGTTEIEPEEVEQKIRALGLPHPDDSTMVGFPKAYED